MRALFDAIDAGVVDGPFLLAGLGLVLYALSERIALRGRS
jgi:hypothetical protein